MGFVSALVRATCAALGVSAAVLGAPALASALPPTISQGFGAGTIPLQGSTSLSFTIGNPNPSAGLTAIGFDDELPAGLAIAAPDGLTGDCGGTVTATNLSVGAPGSRIILSGGTLSPDTECAISLNVVGTWGGGKVNAVTVQSSAGAGNPSSASLAVLPPAAGDRVYWADPGGISYAGLDGSGGGDVGTTGAPEGVVLDPAADRVYWSDPGADSISYASLDGSGGGGRLNTGNATVNEPYGLAIDAANNRLYWVNAGTNTQSIAFAGLDGSGGADLSTSGATVDGPEGLAIDPAAGRIYWSNYLAGTISYANLDGSGGGGQLNLAGATPGNPEGLAVDPAAGRIYWADPSEDKISYAGLDGSGGADLNTTGATVSVPRAVALDPVTGRIYWGNSNPGSVSYAQLDGSGGGGRLHSVYVRNDFLALLRAPTAAGAPAITGGSSPASVLSCSTGTWTPDLPGGFLFHAPRSFAYQWSVDATDIAGATGSSITAAEPGDYRCRVTAANVAGAATQTSAAHAVTAEVAAGPPPAPEGPAPPTHGSPSRTGRSAGAPVLSALRESRAGFAVGRHSRGTVFSFRLDRRAIVRVVIRRGRHRVATLRHTGHAGRNRIRFSGRVAGRALRPGRYRATFTACNRAGTSRARMLSFRIHRRR